MTKRRGINSFNPLIQQLAHVESQTSSRTWSALLPIGTHLDWLDPLPSRMASTQPDNNNLKKKKVRGQSAADYMLSDLYSGGKRLQRFCNASNINPVTTSTHDVRRNRCQAALYKPIAETAGSVPQTCRAARDCFRKWTVFLKA